MKTDTKNEIETEIDIEEFRKEIAAITADLNSLQEPAIELEQPEPELAEVPDDEEPEQLSEENKVILESLTDPDEHDIQFGGTLKEDDSGFTFDNAFQRKIVGMMATSPEAMTAAGSSLKPAYFAIAEHILLFKVVSDFYSKFQILPVKTIVEQELNERLQKPKHQPEETAEAVAKHIQEYDACVKAVEHVPLAWVIDRVSKFRLARETSDAIKVMQDAIAKQKAPAVLLEQASRMQELYTPKLLTKFGYRISELHLIPKPKWLIEDFLVMNTVAQTYGSSDTFKSFAALDQALCIATGKLYLCTQKVEQGFVVYVASEGAEGTRQRIAAWMKHYNWTKPIENFLLVPSDFDLVQPTGVNQLISGIQASTSEMPLAIVIDTLARNFGTGDENNCKDMNGFVKSCERLKTHFKACVHLLHHAGKKLEHGDRGHSAFRGALNTIIQHSRDDKEANYIDVWCDKQKDAKRFPPYRLVANEVSLGLNENQQEETSLVFTRVDIPNKNTEYIYHNRAVLETIPFCNEATADKFGIPEGAFGWNDIAIILNQGAGKAVKEEDIKAAGKHAVGKGQAKSAKGKQNKIFYWRVKASQCVVS